MRGTPPNPSLPVPRVVLSARTMPTFELGAAMRRRDFIKLIGGVATGSWPLAARAQRQDRMRLIGVLMGLPESDPSAQSYVAAFRGAVAKLGWAEGRNLRIEL